MTCKQCIHYKACKGWAGDEVLGFLFDDKYTADENCQEFQANEEAVNATK